LGEDLPEGAFMVPTKNLIHSVTGGIAKFSGLGAGRLAIKGDGGGGATSGGETISGGTEKKC